jgi:hypothetical protein
LGFAVALVFSLLAPPCRADRPKVAIWLAGPYDSQRTELETRIRAELAIAGFDSVELDAAPEADHASLGRAAKSLGCFAAIGVVRQGSLDADVWVTDRITGKAVLRHVHFGADSSDAPAIFALRAVELLHASLLELQEPHPSRGEVRAPPQIQRWAAPPTPHAVPPSREMHAGVVVTGGPGGIPVSIAPALGFAWRPVPTWAGGLELWGPAISHVEGSEGSARIDQEALFAFARYEPLGRSAFSPYLRAGVGASRFGAKGQATAPYTDQSNQLWSALGAVGLGLRIGGQTIQAVTGLDAFWFAPKPAVEFAGRTAATAGQPMLGAHVELGVAW